jgi:hypothetical protein
LADHLLQAKIADQPVICNCCHGIIPHIAVKKTCLIGFSAVNRCERCQIK